MLTKTIRPQFSKKHKEYIAKAGKATVSVAEGAVRAGKTIDNILAFAKQLNDGTPDRIHLATGSTVGNAKLNLGDCNGYGLEHIFRGRCKWTKYRDNEALAIKIRGRQYIVIFVGGSKADSYKKIRGNSYGMWIATEVNLHHESTIQEAFNRQLAAKNRHIFWDLNPSAPNHWIYKDYIDKFPEQFGDRYNYEHFVIQDNATITQQRLEEIEKQYEPNSVWYRRDILGERCQAEGLVYPQFDMQENVATEHGFDGEWYLSMDYGTLNPTAMELWRVNNGTATMEYEYYYNGRELGRQKTDEDYYKDLENFVGDIPIKRIIIDPSSASFRTLIRKHGKFHVMDADNAVLNGIRFTGTLMGERRIKIHKDCSNTLTEINSYRWDESKSEDTVIKQDDHAMDAMRYLCYTLRKKLTLHQTNLLYMGG